jgi:hypothetical protein
VSEPLYLIRKRGAFYRPNAEGYTMNRAEAGRYTLAEAVSHSHPNGPDGPRDGIDYMLADPVESMSHRCETCGTKDGHEPGCAENVPPEDDAPTSPVLELYVADFLAAVREAPGCKHPVASYYPPSPDNILDTLPDTTPASWQVAEGNKWVTCNGSHKWTLTPLGRAVIGYHEARAFGLTEPARKADRSGEGKPDGLDERCGFGGGSVLDSPKSPEWLAACEHLAIRYDHWKLNDKAAQIRAGHPAWLIEQACVEAIMAALPDPTHTREAEGICWRTDIEAAPRDGTRILLMWHDHDNLPAHIELGKMGCGGKGWCNTYGKPFSGGPTHWMPLPPSPAALFAGSAQ